MADLRMSGIGMTSARTRDRLVQRLRDQGITNLAVLDRIRNIPRHIFVDEALGTRAYEDTALPIGFGQTISQPYIVARMIEVLRSGRELGRTLEVGAGCGYQAAVLAQLTDEVYAVERIGPLLAKAKANMRTIQQFKVRLKHADGQWGLPEAAPFDTIILAAAAAHVPQALLQQLALGGKMLLPVLSPSGAGDQFLSLIERRAEGCVETRLDSVHFVPLLSGLE